MSLVLILILINFFTLDHILHSHHWRQRSSSPSWRRLGLHFIIGIAMKNIEHVNMSHKHVHWNVSCWYTHFNSILSSWSFNNFSSLSLALSFDLLMGNFPVSLLSTLSEHWRHHCFEAIFISLLKIDWEKHITLFRIIIFFAKYICKLVTT